MQHIFLTQNKRVFQPNYINVPPQSLYVDISITLNWNWLICVAYKQNDYHFNKQIT